MKFRRDQLNFFQFNRFGDNEREFEMVLPTPKQIKFAHEYLVDFNATRAAIRAGYSARSARSMGHELLNKRGVQATIRRFQYSAEKKAEIDHAAVVLELKKVAFGDVSALLDANGKVRPPQEWTAEMLDVVESFKLVQHYSGRGTNRKLARTSITVKMKDKLKALELLGKHVRKDKK